MRRLIVAAGAALALSGCATHRVTVAEGTRDYPVGAFTALVNEGAANVVLTTGGAPSARATGAVDMLELSEEAGTLRVSTRSQRGWRDAPITLYLTTPSLSAARVDGSGDVRVAAIDGPAFKGDVNGSGNLRVEMLRAKTVRLSTSGSGNTVVTGGAADWLEGSANGSGNLDTRGLRARSVRVSASGSGNVDSWASDTAEVSASGSGNAVVTGGAKCQQRSSGSGGARCG